MQSITHYNGCKALPINNKTHIDTHTNTNTHKFTQIHIKLHTHIKKHTHTNTCIHTYKHTHTYTYTGGGNEAVVDHMPYNIIHHIMRRWWIVCHVYIEYGVELLKEVLLSF